MVEGGAAIIASLIRQQLAHYAVVTVSPRYRPGIRVNALDQPAVAVIQEPTYIQAGSDMMLWGELAWTQEATAITFPADMPTVPSAL
jgi:hypothetical protein